MNSTGMLEHSKKMDSALAGLTVSSYTFPSLQTGAMSLRHPFTGMLAASRGGSCLTNGEWCRDMRYHMKPEKGDLVVKGI
jgi:hypothetical protein